MRTFSTFAILASSLLVRDVHARFDARKRDLYMIQENIMVTEIVTVTAEADGSYKTGTPVAVGTATVHGVPVLVSNVPAAGVPSVTAVKNQNTLTIIKSVTTTPKPVTSAPAVVKPITTPAPVVVPTTPAPVVVPTTLVPAPQPTTATPAPVVNNANKRGLAYNDATLLSAFLGANSKISWSYNWGSGTAAIPSGLEYVPMLWGLGQHVNGWSSAATKAIANGATHLLGFNEPDLGAQSNLSPAAAADGWKTNMQPFAGKAKLGSPAVTNGGNPMGLTWLSSFISQCNGCTIDFVAVHWYNGGDATAFKAYMTNAYAAGGNRPLWITEFEASGDDAQKAAFLQDVMPWLDSQPFVERYAYFGAFNGNLLGSGNTLSVLGKTYAGLA